MAVELEQIAQEAFVQCASFLGNNKRVDGKQPPIPLNWKGTSRLLEARDGLNYRAQALIWHIGLLQREKAILEKQIEDSWLDEHRCFNLRISAQQQLGYILDDVVFNAMSLFDYLAEFVFAVHFTDLRGDKRWNKVIKNIPKISDETLCECLSRAETELVKSLNKYRGNVIHNKPDLGNHRLQTSFGKDGVRHRHDMKLPERFSELISKEIKDKHRHTQVDIGSFIFVEMCLKHNIHALKALASFEYNPASTAT